MPPSDCPVAAALQCKRKSFSEASVSGLQIRQYHSIGDIPRADWQQLLSPDDVFMSVDYWKDFEKSVSNNVGFRYLVFHHRQELAGVAAFQIIQFNATNITNEEELKAKSWSQQLITRALQPFAFRVLVMGNTFMTGNYGLRIRGGEVDQNHAAWLLQGIEDITNMERSSGNPISGVLIKDFFQDEAPGLDLLQQAGYLKTQGQPNMVLHIDPKWKDFKGYLSAMSSKYRMRVKRALKDMKDITVRPLTKDEISQHMPRIEELYQQVIGQSSFKLATFDIAHLQPMKDTFGARLYCDGFFQGDKLVGFTSMLQHEDAMAAGMLGLNKELQREYDLYFNMLIHIAKRGIESNVSRVIMGRTAMEIKSSIGAVPFDMNIYVRHTSNWKNFFIRRIINFLNKPEDWHQRHPFKKGK